MDIDLRKSIIDEYNEKFDKHGFNNAFELWKNSNFFNADDIIVFLEHYFKIMSYQ